MTVVGVLGAATELGALVSAFAAADPQVAAAVPVHPDGTADVDALVLLAPGGGHDDDGTSLGGTDVSGARRVLDRCAASTVVVVSSAMVYGAGPDTPLPITEDAPVQPIEGARHAQDRAALERAVRDWQRDRTDATVAVLRPPICIAPSEAPKWLERSAWHARSLRQLGRDRPAQFLHLHDLATAIDHARRHRLDGAFNVAPDGWLTARVQLELVGA
ncbi:MAG: NAD-dependent epimerase/dehydratase family protein, partial [Actinomycetes bacterium]